MAERKEFQRFSVTCPRRGKNSRKDGKRAHGGEAKRHREQPRGSRFSYHGVVHLYYSRGPIVIASSSLTRSLNRSRDNFGADKKLITPTFNKRRRIIYFPTRSCTSTLSLSLFLFFLSSLIPNVSRFLSSTCTVVDSVSALFDYPRGKIITTSFCTACVTKKFV